MSIFRRPMVVFGAGLLAICLLAIIAGARNGPGMARDLSAAAGDAIAAAGHGGQVSARLSTANGWPSRHAVLAADPRLTDPERDTIAKAVSAMPGIGGVRWTDSGSLGDNAAILLHPSHCQNEIEALLSARNIHFEESSAAIDPASQGLLDEVATALRPCLGSIVGIGGHTDSSGPAVRNLELSRERARAVRSALIRRGIAADGLIASGYGSQQPMEGLPASDPTNRRIEFSVLAVKPITPTPVDLPGPR